MLKYQFDTYVHGKMLYLLFKEIINNNTTLEKDERKTRNKRRVNYKEPEERSV